MLAGIDRNSCLLYAKQLAERSTWLQDLALSGIAMVQDGAQDLEGLRQTFHAIKRTKAIVQPYLIHCLVRHHLFQEAFELVEPLDWRTSVLERQTIRALSAVRDFSALPPSQHPCIQAGLVLAYTRTNQDAEAESLLQTISSLSLKVFVHVERVRIKRHQKRLYQASQLAQEALGLIDQLPTELEKRQGIEWLALMYAETGDFQTALDLFSEPSDENCLPVQKSAGMKSVQTLLMEYQAEQGHPVEGDQEEVLSCMVHGLSKKREFRAAIRKIGLIPSSRGKDYARLMVIEDLVRAAQIDAARNQAFKIRANHIQAVAWACIAYA